MSDEAAVVTTTLGQALREARTNAGRTLEEVSAATRIRAQLLRDLEGDRLDTCGGAVYARGHVRAVAHFLGVDACPLVARFDEQSGTTAPAPVVVSPVPLPRRPTSSLHVPLAAPLERRSPRWMLAGMATLVVLGGLYAVGTGVGGSEVSADPDRAPSAPTASTAASAPPAAAPAPKPKPPPPPSGAVLGLRLAGGASWVSVSAGGKVLYEGTAPDGWAKTFNDPARLRVRVGNAGAVRISCRDGVGAPAGAVGAVLTLWCAPEGLVRP